jgi:hypothetical protein
MSDVKFKGISSEVQVSDELVFKGISAEVDVIEENIFKGLSVEFELNGGFAQIIKKKRK